MLALTGGKGGCGKTTTALGLARTLTQQGHDPLVVDTDCDMPDLHHVARIERTFGTDALAAGTPTAHTVQYSDRFPGVALVTAGGPDQTGAALRGIDWPGPVLVDCPAGVGPDATCPLRAADATLVVTTDEPQSLEDSRRTVRAAHQLEAPPVGVLVRAVLAGTDCVPETVGSCPVLAAVPSVTDPFDTPQVARAWDSLAAVTGESGCRPAGPPQP
jgi:septum site-determining protein MinD